MTFNTLHFLNSYFHFTISSLEDFIDISQSLNEKHQSTEFWQVSFCRIRMFKPVQSTVVNPSIWICKSFMTRWRRKIGNWSQEFVVFSLLVVKHLWQKMADVYIWKWNMDSRLIYWNIWLKVKREGIAILIRRLKFVEASLRITP